MLHLRSMPALIAEAMFGSDYAPGPRLWRCLIYFTTTLAAVSWTLFAGKDLNWDALNYHLYSGFSALNDRFVRDFFPAGAASYFNPLAHVPLYLMVKADIPAIVIGATLAAIHSVSLWLTYELALLINRDMKQPTRQGIACLAVVLAALNPVFLQATGSTFSDLTTGPFVLAGWLGLVHASRSSRPSLGVLLAGAVLGVATALKLSNGLFAVAALPMVLLMPGPVGTRLTRVTVFGAGASVCFIAVAAPWAWKLWQHFGNPLFPLFNAWFESPDFITESLKHTRFIPESLTSAVSLPFRMAIPERMIHTEPRAPDVRYAALFVGVLIWAAIALARCRQRDESKASVGVASNELLALTLSFVLAWILWTAVSGNSRYFVPMACVAAVALATLLHRLSPSARLVGYLAVALVGVQLTQVALGAQLRWTENRWAGPWFRVVVPDRFKSDAYFYLSLDVQSGSFLAPFVAHDSGFMNVSGSYVLGPGKPGGERAQRLIRENGHRLRSLLPIQRVDTEGRPLPPSAAALNDRLWRFGLQVDTRDCEYFEIDGGLDLLIFTDGNPRPRERLRTTHFMTCKLVTTDRDMTAYRVEEKWANTIFDNVEDACPNLFHPRRTVADKKGAWARHYVLGSDLQLWIFDGRVKYSNPVVGGEPIVIGRARDWERGPQALDCSKKRGVGFEGILP